MDRNVRFFCENATFEMQMPHPVSATIFGKLVVNFALKHGAPSTLPGAPGWREEGGGLLLVSWPGLYLDRNLLKQDPALILMATTLLPPNFNSTRDRLIQAGALAPGLGYPANGNGDALFEEDADADEAPSGREPFFEQTQGDDTASGDAAGQPAHAADRRQAPASELSPPHAAGDRPAPGGEDVSRSDPG